MCLWVQYKRPLSSFQTAAVLWGVSLTRQALWTHDNQSSSQSIVIDRCNWQSACRDSVLLRDTEVCWPGDMEEGYREECEHLTELCDRWVDVEQPCHVTVSCKHMRDKMWPNIKNVLLGTGQSSSIKWQLQLCTEYIFAIIPKLCEPKRPNLEHSRVLVGEQDISTCSTVNTKLKAYLPIISYYISPVADWPSGQIPMGRYWSGPVGLVNTSSINLRYRGGPVW